MAWDETLPKLLYTILEKQQPRSFSLQEAQHLVERLDQAQDPHRTPTGQPIRLFLSREMLESLFR
jgi:DNA mismatch repair ATPase MutL